MNSAQALKDADATLRKSGYVDRRDSLNDDADFVAAERRAARRIRDFVAFPTSDKFHLVDAAVAAALRGDGRHTDDGAAYDGALLDALHALVSFGFCARMSDVAANAAALIGLLDARRRAVAPRLLPDRGGRRGSLLLEPAPRSDLVDADGRLRGLDATIKMVRVLERSLDVLENWRVGRFVRAGVERRSSVVFRAPGKGRTADAATLP